jgi:hypothetical protein
VRVEILVEPDGAQRITAERWRQVEKEHWDYDHDDDHSPGSLASAGLAYAMRAVSQLERKPHDPNLLPNDVPREWPWDDDDWKPSPDPLRNLEKAGALIAAEIDRVLREQLHKKLGK